MKLGLAQRHPSRVVVSLLVTAVVATSCGGNDDDTSTATTKAPATTSKSTETTAEEGGPPELPALEEVTDPGTIDPVLGDFPVDESRAVQFAWVNLAEEGRTYTADLRAVEEMLMEYSESDLYLDGVYVCTDLRQNFAVGSTAEDRGLTYQTDENPITDERAAEVGAAILAAAVNDLCPDMEILLSDPDFQVPTPAAVRSILGVDEADLDDADANRFANYVCEELNRGTTSSRLVSDVADEFDYPDDLAESLIDYIEGNVC